MRCICTRSAAVRRTSTKAIRSTSRSGARARATTRALRRPAVRHRLPARSRLDFSNDASLAGSYTANVISQNGFASGMLSNITVGQDGTVDGIVHERPTERCSRKSRLPRSKTKTASQRVGSNQFQQTSASGLAANRHGRKRPLRHDRRRHARAVERQPCGSVHEAHRGATRVRSEHARHHDGRPEPDHARSTCARRKTNRIVFKD